MAEKEEKRVEESANYFCPSLWGKQSIPKNAYQICPYILLARTKSYGSPLATKGTWQVS